MKLGALYKAVVEAGASCDVRKRSAIRSFEDSALFHGDPSIHVRSILVGIDIEVGELLLADKIRNERGLDLVIAHHPEGAALIGLVDVMKLQADLLKKVGIAAHVADEFILQRRLEVDRRITTGNYMRAVDVARILDIPFMNIHTPADNHASVFLDRLFSKEKPKTVQDIFDLLMGIPEYKEAASVLAGPRIILGNPKRPAGKIFVEMTGGTEGPKDVYESLYKKGIRTLVSMHISEDHFRNIKNANLNVVLAGHMSSDTLGLNLLFDRLERVAKEQFQIIECSGFRRFRRS
ncbi:MAG TPA: NGG1p interacting factor NIF3 [Candidatus Omnitrophota bacterium]|nr:NGG1p interacting factor NIF3 [Candidatus Omnitrophota bacterium]HPT07588.1 NGG1p interacting factor NIF3 [Candidatus Omnitrophota bacterium]